MIFDNGEPLILGCSRTNSAGSTFQLPTTDAVSGGSIRVGDLCIMTDVACNTAAGIPSGATPSGFTFVNGTTGFDAGSRGVRTQVHYKILTAPDLGNTFTSMNGARSNRKMITIYRMNQALASCTSLSYFDVAVTGGIPSNVLVSGTSSLTGSVLMTSFVLSEGDAATLQTANHTWNGSIPVLGSPYVNPAKSTDWGGITLNDAMSYYEFYPRELTKRSVTTVETSSDFGNWTWQCFATFRLT